MRVLIAVGADSEYANRICEFVLNYRWEAQCHFKILHCLDPQYLQNFVLDAYAYSLVPEVEKLRREQAEELLENVRSKLTNGLPNATVEVEVVEGFPKECIIETARDWNAEIIVMGTHSVVGFSRTLFGSVSLTVCSQAPCSVLLIPDKLSLPVGKPAKVAGCDRHS